MFTLRFYCADRVTHVLQVPHYSVSSFDNRKVVTVYPDLTTENGVEYIISDAEQTKADPHLLTSWSVTSDKNCHIIDSVRNSKLGKPVNGVTGTNRKANDKRIVLCVNALEGVPTEALEGGWTAQGISTYAKSLERNQNDMVECLLRILVIAQTAGNEPEKDSNNPYKAFLYEAGQLVRRCGTEDQVRSLADNQ